MLRLEARPEPSRTMLLASPLIALVLTALVAALPMWLLFEVGLLMSRILLPDRGSPAGEEQE